MNRNLLLLLSLLSFVQISNAQFLWYENETNTYKIEKESTQFGTFLTDVLNPDITGINTNTTASQFNREEGENGFLYFDLFNPVIDFSGYSITIKAYLDLPTSSLTAANSKLRVYFQNSSTGGTPYKQLNFTLGQEWETFTFDFDGTDIPQEIIDAGGYNLVQIGFATGSQTLPAMTYYIDSIIGTTDQVVDDTNHPANWLAGSWGITFPVYGGERLDSEVAGGYDYRAGAQEIIDDLPATGHVITNLSNFAKSYYFTLRDNPNVDIATEIDELLVPSLANEAIIFDVLQKFKNAGKKNILYISTNYFDRLESSNNVDFNAAHASWVTYYTNNFAGNEYLAYKDLVQGFILRVKDYADGYWLDTSSELLDDGHLEDFVQMIRDADPGAIMGAQPAGTYFTDENGENLLVDSDGLDDDDETDYKIIKFEANCTYQDYTKGHVTPLGQGAPPNSWAYDEFTIPAMEANPWSMFEGNTVLKHAWFPVREKWHVSSFPIVFGIEDAYRFAKRLVDANAGVTFATTIDDVNDKGHMMDDEMLIMKTINDRLLSIPVPDFEPYVRPEGAYLVGETLSTNSDDFTNQSDVKFYPNPVADQLTISRITTDLNYITVVNALGTKVLNETWDNGTTTTQLDVSTLNSGIYFIKLSNGNNHSIIRKIIVSK